MEAVKVKTSMLGERQRRALVERWPEVMAKGVLDERDNVLFPGDVVCLPACVWDGSGPDVDVPGTVMGFAIGKDGSPSVVVDAPAWSGYRADSWRTWIVNGDFCNRIDSAQLSRLVATMEYEGLAVPGAPVVAERAASLALAPSWLALVVDGVRTRAGVAIVPGDLVRLPRNVARNRGSQLHAAGLCLGYAVGLDGAPYVVVDAVGEDVPELVRWRTWLAHGGKCLVIDTKEAWRLEGMYTRDGRLKPKEPKRR